MVWYVNSTKTVEYVFSTNILPCTGGRDNQVKYTQKNETNL